MFICICDFAEKKEKIEKRYIDIFVHFFGGSYNSFHLIYLMLQLVEAIAELQSQGYNIPNYNPNPTTEEETDAKYKAFLFFFFLLFLLFTKKSAVKTVCEGEMDYAAGLGYRRRLGFSPANLFLLGQSAPLSSFGL